MINLILLIAACPVGVLSYSLVQFHVVRLAGAGLARALRVASPVLFLSGCLTAPSA